MDMDIGTAIKRVQYAWAKRQRTPYYYACENTRYRVECCLTPQRNLLFLSVLQADETWKEVGAYNTLRALSGEDAANYLLWNPNKSYR